ncbi:MAG TPA: GH92 family glycosyl hydrolase [Streptosporangiaceae bacterium]|nr:GH92 family glycosyl hydrolase [Streptosporangiaceae bacterium]
MRRRLLRVGPPLGFPAGPLVLVSAAGLVFGAGFVVSPAFAGTAGSGVARPGLVTDPASMVNTKVQTGIGDDFPGSQAPFGMIQWSPNMQSRSAGGNYDNSSTQLLGYALTNLAGPGCGAMGDDPVMPMTGAAPSNVNGTMVSYDHSTEVSTAGYFSAKSSNDTIQTELTTTQRTGMARFMFPSTAQADVLVKLRDSQNQTSTDPSTAQIVSNTEVTGTTVSGHFCGDVATYTLHFDMVFDQPFTSKILGNGSSGPNGIFLQFNTTSSQVVQAKVGVSFVSTANAKLNLQTENPNWDFNAVRTATHNAWNSYLGKIQIAGGTMNQRILFYSDLYHVLQFPDAVSDVNGQYMGFDHQVHTVVAGQSAHYENFSGWDIYHNEASLAALLAPKETGDMATSMMEAYQQIKLIPEWGFMNSKNGVMIGDPAPAEVAQYYAFGARSVDDQQLLADLVKQATTDNPIRGNTSTYDQLGYTPNDPSTTVEWTQEDFALSRLALSLGDTKDANFLAKRATNWKNIFDPSTGYLSPRNSDGSFVHVTGSDTSDYVEGSAAEYRFQVPTDQPVQAQMLGGDSATNSLLDSLFRAFNGQTPTVSLLTNEFDLGQPWFYNWTGEPSHTQSVVHRWLDSTYRDDCCTFPNNDDLGTMSAQYVWASMGIYPEDLGIADVTLNSPTFTKVLIHLTSGKTLSITAPAASKSNYYIQSMKVNGTASTKTWAPASMFTNGGTLNFTLGSSPSNWGTGSGDIPPYYDGTTTPTGG